MYDISVALSSELVHWPGEAGFALDSRKKKAEVVVSELHCGAHTGTHIDAPYHFLAAGQRVHELSLVPFLGRVRVLPIEGLHVTRSELSGHSFAGVQRVLFVTRNSRQKWWNCEFDPEFAGLELDAAEFLTEKGCLLVGIDYLSIEPRHSDGSVHRLLLGSGVAILEGLNLRDVPQGDYFLSALPLKVQDGDGTPVRAVLLEEHELQW
ncbi:MAG: cyclase family protein [Spirochaetales bacterium]|nr:cyclase family protein [Spirochaetales bacterium]